MAKAAKKIVRITEPPMPEPRLCPICGKSVTPYLLANYGMIWCNPSNGGCGLKLQRAEGLRTVIEWWNRRADV